MSETETPFEVAERNTRGGPASGRRAAFWYDLVKDKLTLTKRENKVRCYTFMLLRFRFNCYKGAFYFKMAQMSKSLISARLH